MDTITDHSVIFHGCVLIAVFVLIMATNCAIPGCHWTRRSKDKRSLFTILRPDLAKSPEDCRHRQGLTRFILTLRDSSAKGDCIKALLHKETAAICDQHFTKDDLLFVGDKKQLRCGAIPSLNLPSKSYPHTSVSKRKPPAKRDAGCMTQLKRKYINLASLKAATKNITDGWLFVDGGDSLIFEKQSTAVVPEFRIVITNELEVKSVAYYGWQLGIERLQLPQIACTNLKSWLCKVKKLEVCQGVRAYIPGAATHPILKWNESESRLLIENIARSRNCCVVEKELWNTSNTCKECYEFNLKNSVELASSLEVNEDGDVELEEVSQQRAKVLEWQKAFSLCQAKNGTTNKHARRYHPDVIQWSIELFSRSPSAYKFVRSSNILTLPSVTTIQNYRNYIKPESGINKIAISEIDRVMDKSIELPAYITLDEMKIRERLVVKDGKLVGFIDSPVSGKCVIASHILVFYVRTIHKEVSLPLAWYPTHSITADEMSFYFWELLDECEKRGLKIHAVVADGLSVNRSFFKIIAGLSKIPLESTFTAPNPYDPTRPIFLCSDPQHLLKTARNSLFSSKPGGTRYMNMAGQGKDILWTDIKSLYNTESSSLALYQSGLTLAHVNLTPRTKMNVKLATGVFSHKVGHCLKAMGACGTSDFVLMMERWFNIVTCRITYPIGRMSDPRILWLAEFSEKMIKWKRNAESRRETKRMMALPTMEGLIFTSNNLIAISERLLKDMPKLALGTFTQDVLEAFFGNIRQMGRRRTNPDVAEVAYDIHHITQARIARRQDRPYALAPAPKRKKSQS